MAEKLTPDGHLWRDGTGRPYVWLPRAQALADRADAALRAEKALRAQLEAERKIGADVSQIARVFQVGRDEARKELETANARNASQRKANARMQAEYDALNAKYEHARQNMIRDVAAARADLAEAHKLIAKLTAERDEARADYETTKAFYEDERRQLDEMRQRAEAAEQREARLQDALNEAVETMAAVERIAPGYNWNADRLFLTRLIGKFYEVAKDALADVPAAPAAEPQPATLGRRVSREPKRATCPKCSKTTMFRWNPQATNYQDPGWQCQSCGHLFESGIGTTQDRADFSEIEASEAYAPTALDPALREPLPRGREIVRGACNRMKNSDLLASSKPVTVAIDQVVDEASDRIEKLWRWIDGEPERTRQAVAAKLRQFAKRPYLTATERRELNDEADQLAPPPQQGGTEGREK